MKKRVAQTNINRENTKPGFIGRIRAGLSRFIGAELKENIIGWEEDVEIDPADPLNRIFRPFGQGRSIRTLPSSLMDEQHRQAYRSLVENPFINRLAKLKGDFIVGGGIAFKSEDDRVQAYLDDFTKDKVNALDTRMRTIASEFRLFGEIVWEKVVNRSSGQVRLNARDPLEISAVLGHPKYGLIPSKIAFRSMTGEVVAEIVNTLPDDLRPPPTPMPQVYYHRANAWTGSLRGISDFYAALEWADALDAASFSMLERMVVLLTFCWHAKMQRLDPKVRDEISRTLQNARPNTVLVTTNDIDLNAVAPDLKAADFSEGARYIKQQIAMAAGVPENWMGQAGVANVGESASMDMPSLKSLACDQAEFIEALRATVDDALEEGFKAGSVPPNAAELYTIEVEPVSKRELNQVVTAAASLSSSLSQARNEGWLDHEEAARTFRHVVGQIVDLAEELPDAEKDALTRGMKPDDLDQFKGLADRIGTDQTNGAAKKNGSVAS